MVIHSFPLASIVMRRSNEGMRWRRRRRRRRRLLSMMMMIIPLLASTVGVTRRFVMAITVRRGIRTIIVVVSMTIGRGYMLMIGDLVIVSWRAAAARRRMRQRRRWWRITVGHGEIRSDYLGTLTVNVFVVDLGCDYCWICLLSFRSFQAINL
jgi:hypothetical protein